MKSIKAEIITIGDELLLGQTIDTNSAWLGKELHTRGIDVHQITSITDDSSHIASALSDAESRCDLILLTGGLGPTKDDLTKSTLVEYFNTSLVLNQAMYDKIETFFNNHNRKMIESNVQQAYLPKSCTPIINEVGTAAGMWFEKSGKIIVSMPGVPFEMKKMMFDSIFPRISDFFDTEQLFYRMVYTIGIGESFLAETIKAWENSLVDEGIKLAYLPERGRVKLRLLSRGEDKEMVIRKIESKIEALKKIVPSYIVSKGQYEQSTNGSAYVGELLRRRGETLATAESCTGGAIANAIVQVAGSSDYFVGSIVPYHTHIKVQELGVDPQLIAKHGVVSTEVAEAMAVGVSEKMKSDWGLATTGFAGPTGGDEHAAVGTVCIGISYRGDCFSEVVHYQENRATVIKNAATKAVMMLKERILLKDI